MKEIIKEINKWKETYYNDKWEKTTNENKFYQLSWLIGRLTLIENNLVKVKQGNEYNYNKKTKTITLNQNEPDILKTLQEYTHHSNILTTHHLKTLPRFF